MPFSASDTASRGVLILGGTTEFQGRGMYSA
jgi:hypothetical protein